MSDDPNVEITTTNDGETTVVAAIAETTPSAPDPLDAITDPVELRNRAKGYRHERNEYRDGKREPRVQKPAQDTDQFFTKEDNLRVATKTAKAIVTDEIRENWDALIEYVPAKHHSAETPDEIKKAMEIALVAYRQDNPKPDTSGEDAAADLTKDTGTKGHSQPAKPTAPTEEPSWAKKPKGPEDWYKKPQQ